MSRSRPRTHEDPSATLKEVRQFLDARRETYLEMAQSVLRDLAAFRDRADMRQRIYRIYSRQDKQVGSEPLKSDWKIARKLAKWRETKPQVSPKDIHDIVGVTVVTYFASQLEDVVAALRKPLSKGGLGAYGVEEKRQRGYHAIHVRVDREGVRFRGMSCEVQVKTLLHDGWATKTHDLTYKPRARTQTDLINQMELIGDEVQLLERHSDILRAMIEREWERERRNRGRAQRQLLLAFAQRSKLAFDRTVADAARAIERDLVTLANCGESHKVFRKHFDTWDRLARKHGHVRQTCRLITLLASARPSRDLDMVALDSIDRWVNESADARSRLHAMHFRALAAYGFDDMDGAIEQARATLAFATRSRIPATGAQINLAYYMANKQARGEYEDHRGPAREAKRLVSQALSAIPEDKKASYLDSKGAVAIAFGETQDEVREGLKNCREAVAMLDRDHPQRQSLEAYCQLHEQWAWKRLSEEW